MNDNHSRCSIALVLRATLLLFVLSMISQVNNWVDVGGTVFVGRPEALGETAYVRAAFELPLPRFDHARYFFDVRVLLNWQDGGGKSQGLVLSQSSFSWEAE